MPLLPTLLLLAAFVAICAFGSWRMSKPADPLRPRLIPWRPIMLASGVGAVLMVVHIANLFGVETGGR